MSAEFEKLFFAPKSLDIGVRPDEIFEPDLDHPHLKGCRIWLPFTDGNALDLISNHQFTNNGNVAWRTFVAGDLVSAQGVAPYLDNDHTTYFSGFPGYDFSNGEFTVYAFFNTGSGANEQVVSRSNESGTNKTVRCGFDMNGTSEFLVADSGGNWVGDSITWNNASTLYKDTHAFWYFSNSARQSLKGGYFRQGDKWSTGTASTITDGPKAHSSDIRLGYGIGHANGAYLFDIRIYDRVLPETECFEIAHNSFAPYAKTGWLPARVAAGGPSDILFQNQLHQIHDGLIAQTASGLNGVLVT